MKLKQIGGSAWTVPLNTKKVTIYVFQACKYILWHILVGVNFFKLIPYFLINDDNYYFLIYEFYKGKTLLGWSF